MKRLGTRLHPPFFSKEIPIQNLARDCPALSVTNRKRQKVKLRPVANLKWRTCFDPRNILTIFLFFKILEP